jgi:hypothetical protein
MIAEYALNGEDVRGMMLDVMEGQFSLKDRRLPKFDGADDESAAESGG